MHCITTMYTNSIRRVPTSFQQVNAYLAAFFILRSNGTESIAGCLQGRRAYQRALQRGNRERTRGKESPDREERSSRFPPCTRNHSIKQRAERQYGPWSSLPTSPTLFHDVRRAEQDASSVGSSNIRNSFLHAESSLQNMQGEKGTSCATNSGEV